MKFGLTRANVVGGGSPQATRIVVDAAETLGFDSLWAVEHVVWPTTMTSKYPYSPDGSLPSGTTMSPFPEPLAWLAFVAGISSSIRLSTGILVVPQREPILLAKQLATLDQLSGGRMQLGVGIGWLREEFELLGADFRDRGRRTEDYIAAMRALWTEDISSVDRVTIAFDGALMFPKPVQRGGVPIVFGGGKAAAERAGRIGDGYYPSPSTGPDAVPELLDVMRRAADAAGRDVSQIEVSALSQPDVATIERLGELGVHRVLVSALGIDPSDRDVVGSSAKRTADGLVRFADEVIAKLG